MTHPAYLRIGVTGAERTALRQSLHNYLTHTWDFRRPPARKKMVTYYGRSHLSVEECARLVSALFNISSTFGSDATLSYVLIDAFPGVYLHLINPPK